jgi:hypothetical protein
MGQISAPADPENTVEAEIPTQQKTTVNLNNTKQEFEISTNQSSLSKATALQPTQIDGATGAGVNRVGAADDDGAIKINSGGIKAEELITGIKGKTSLATTPDLKADDSGLSKIEAGSAIKRNSDDISYSNAHFKKSEPPSSHLAQPTNAPEMKNTEILSKENIDMTCSGMNKCVRFTACLYKDCDPTKQVSQLFAFKSPRSKTVYPVSKSNVAKNVNPDDDLCWSAPESQFSDVACSVNGACTTEGAEAGDCTAAGEKDIMNPLIDKDLHPNNPMVKGDPGSWRHSVGGGTYVGKAQCARKPAGTCKPVAPQLICENQKISLSLPASVKCLSEVDNTPCSLTYDLKTEPKLASVDLSKASSIVLKANIYSSFRYNPGLCNNGDLKPKYPLTLVYNGAPSVTNYDTSGKKIIKTTAGISDGILKMENSPTGWGKTRARGCISDIDLEVTLPVDPRCVSKTPVPDVKGPTPASIKGHPKGDLPPDSILGAITQ